MERVVHRVGFPADTDEQVAVESALETVAAHQLSLGHPLRPGANVRVMRSAEAAENGEFLVRVDGLVD